MRLLLLYQAECERCFWVRLVAEGTRDAAVSKQTARCLSRAYHPILYVHVFAYMQNVISRKSTLRLSSAEREAC